MKDVIIFSQENFTLIYNDKKFYINKNAYIKINNYNPNEIIRIDNYAGSLQLYLNNLNTNNFYKIFNYKDKLYVEIIATSFNNLLHKFNTKSSEVFVYENSVRLIKNHKCYTNYFKCGSDNYVIEENDCLYIFNEKNIIIFNFKHKTFSNLKTEKLNKNGNFIEILCKIPYNFNYFLHFSANIQKNTINIKKYKRGEDIIYTENIFNQFFYLCKHSINDAKKFTSNNLNIQDIIDYLQRYENVLEIYGEYFIYNQTDFIPINIKINDGKIIDID